MPPSHEELIDHILSLAFMAAESESLAAAIFHALHSDPEFRPVLNATIEQMRRDGKIRPHQWAEEAQP